MVDHHIMKLKRKGIPIEKTKSREEVMKIIRKTDPHHSQSIRIHSQCRK